MDGGSVVKTRFFFCLVHSSIPAASPWGARFFYTATHATKRNDAHEKEGESGGRDAHTHTETALARCTDDAREWMEKCGVLKRGVTRPALPFSSFSFVARGRAQTQQPLKWRGCCGDTHQPTRAAVRAFFFL